MNNLYNSDGKSSNHGRTSSAESQLSDSTLNSIQSSIDYSSNNDETMKANKLNSKIYSFAELNCVATISTQYNEELNSNNHNTNYLPPLHISEDIIKPEYTHSSSPGTLYESVVSNPKISTTSQASPSSQHKLRNHHAQYSLTPIVTPGVVSIPTFTQQQKRTRIVTPCVFRPASGDSVPLSLNKNGIRASTTSFLESMERGQPLPQVLNAHNISSITLCSVFGTGLLVNSASILDLCGPVPFLCGFFFIGLLSYQVVSALCEMCTYIPLPNAYSGYTERFVDPALGYTLGYFYLIQYLILGPAQILAGSLTIQYWVPTTKVSPAVWMSIFIIVLTLLNYIDISKVALVADVFVIIKLLIYLFITIMLLIIICGVNNGNEVIGFKYWLIPGVVNAKAYDSINSTFVGGFVAFASATTSSIFPFVGVESFCVTVSEAYYPRRTIPKAKNLLFASLLFAYFPIVVFIGMAVAYNDESFPKVLKNQEMTTAAGSAIIIAIKNAGLKILPNVLNGFILIFVLSATNSSFYMSTRILYGLSACGLAPAVFSKVSQKGIPLNAILLVFLFNCLAYVGIAESSRRLFELFSNSVCGFSLILWACILITHICFLKAMKMQNVDRGSITYRAKGGVVLSAIALAFCVILLICREFTVFLEIHSQSFDYKRIVSGYVCIPVFGIVFLIFKLCYKTSFVRPSEADLFFYKDCVDATEDEYISKELQEYSIKTGTGKVKQIYQRIFV